MKIIRSKIIHGNFDTDLFSILENIPDNILYHSEHTLRHPKAIYYLASTRLYESFEECLNLLQNYDNSNNQRTFFLAYKEVLDSLMSFIDDTYNILKCFYPASSVRKNIIFAHKWVEQADKKTYNDYNSRITNYREKLAPIVNKIKHEHGRFRSIEFVTSIGNIYGYFIEGVESDGTVYPDKSIHKPYKGFPTAISFNRDLKFHIINFFDVAHQLKVVISKFISKKHNITLPNATHNGSKDTQILQICSMIANLPNLFFYDEYDKQIPEVKIYSDQELEFIYGNNKIIQPYVNAKISVETTITDGTSKYFKFRVPYWQS